MQALDQLLPNETFQGNTLHPPTTASIKSPLVGLVNQAQLLSQLGHVLYACDVLHCTLDQV